MNRPKPESAIFVYPKKSKPFIFCSEDCAVLYGFNLTGADKIKWKKITVYAYPSCDNCHQEINRTPNGIFRSYRNIITRRTILSNVKKGTYVKRKKDSTTVYVKGEYDRTTKTYSLSDTLDFNREIFLKGSTLVDVDFTY